MCNLGLNFLPLVQSPKAITLNAFEMRKKILASIIRSNDPRSIRIIEQLRCSGRHDYAISISAVFIHRKLSSVDEMRRLKWYSVGKKPCAT